jgi:CDP-glycerol glycerophosphotransferase
MQRRPCLLYATDVAQYDRGYYFNFRDLPYPLAETEDELVALVENFDAEAYAAKLEEFFTQRVGLKEEGRAAEALAEWMVSRALED